MKFNRWNLAIVPVILVLGLIWYEFWTTGAFAPRQRPSPPTDTQAAAPTPEPSVPSPPGGASIGASPATASAVAGGPPRATLTPEHVEDTARNVAAVAPAPAPAPAPNVAPAPKTLVIDDAFLNNPPPISIDVSNVPLTGVVDALRTSFNMPSNLQVDPNLRNYGGADRMFTLQAKNASFWDVFKMLQAQGAIGFQMGGTAGGGLTLSTQNYLVYHFQASGPAILVPMSITFNRSVSGQDDPAADRSPATCMFSYGAAIDPRIPVARGGMLEIQEATDDAGRAVAVPNNPGGNVGTMDSNFWTATASLPLPYDNRAHKLNLKCQLHYFLQLPSGIATLEDAAKKVGEELDLGDRKFHLAAFDVQGNRITLQISADDGVQSAVNAAITDSAGRIQSFNTQTNTPRSYSLAAFSPPFRLTLRDPNAVREMTVPFEIKDLPLP